jgi:RNA polymerase sigma factor (sigma-70 family)
MSTGREAPIESLMLESRWLRRLAGSLVSEDAEDAVQDTYLAAMSSPPSLDRPVRPWLGQVLRNFVRMRRRSRGRATRFEHSLATQPARHVPSAEEVLAAHELQRQVAEAVSALDEPFRATILLRYSQGLSSAQIAARLGIPAGTVRSRLKRGLEELRAHLDRRHGGDRERWRSVLAPLAAAELPGRRSATAATSKLTMGASIATLVAVCGLIGVSTRGSTFRTEPAATHEPARVPGAHRSSLPVPNATSPRDTKGPTMTSPRTSATQTKTLAIAIAALAAASAGAGRAGAEGPELSRPEAVAECVAIREKVLTCRDEYAAQAVQQHLDERKKTVSADERKAMEAKVADKATKDGAGPRPGREASCGQMLDYLSKRGAKATRAGVQALHACFDKSDCRTRISCYLTESAQLIPKKTTP